MCDLVGAQRAERAAHGDGPKFDPGNSSIAVARCDRDKAEAMAAYARQAKDTELIQFATEIKVRAERKCGELLRDSAARGERATAESGRPAEVSKASTLSDIGITRDQSSRYQSLASMSEAHFETAVATAKDTVWITRTRLRRVISTADAAHLIQVTIKRILGRPRPRQACDIHPKMVRTWREVA